MAAPHSSSNSAPDRTDVENEKARSNHDVPSERQTQTDLSKIDLEKGGEQSRADSYKSEERTLNGDDVPANPGTETRDPNIVDWDGPDDPDNPQNWPDSKKWRIIGVLAAVTLVT
jgi:hypothetical protein